MTTTLPAKLAVSRWYCGRCGCVFGSADLPCWQERRFDGNDIDSACPCCAGYGWKGPVGDSPAWADLLAERGRVPETPRRKRCGNGCPDRGDACPVLARILGQPGATDG